MKRVAFAVPGSLDTPTGGYAYDRRIMAELRQLGWEVDYLNIGEGFPEPDEATRSAARSLLSAIPAGQPIVLDGLALGVLPDVAAELAREHPLVALVHHPLALESGLTCRARRRPSPQRTGGARRSSGSRGDEPGNGKASRSRLWRTGPNTSRLRGPEAIPRRGLHESQTRCRISCRLGRSCRAKGSTCSSAALATLADLRVAAYDRRRPHAGSDEAAKLRRQLISRHRLTGRIEMLGAVSPSRLAMLYRRSRSVRPRLALRRLRNGLRRSVVARPSRDRNDGRSDTRYDPARSGIAGAAR